MHRTPDEASDETINELWEGGPVLPSVIDLTARAYDIEVEHLPHAPWHSRWRAVDMNTFDGGPDAPGSFQGYGSSSKEARMALLVQFAEYDAEQYDRTHAKPSRVVHSSPFGPPEYADREPRDRPTDHDP